MDAIGFLQSSTVMPKRLPSVTGVEQSMDGAVAAGQSGSGFANAISEALDQVSRMQSEASGLTREFQLENAKVSLEESMISLQKASLGFQATVQVRNRLVQAYNDVMNMNV